MPSWPDAAPPRGVGTKRGRLIAVLVLLVAAVGASAYWIRTRGTPATPTGTGAAPSVSTAAALSDTSARAPGGTRVVVRVINATSIRGLARRATLWLRDFGYDVVDFDSAPKMGRTETLIEVHTGQDAWGERVRKAMGVGRVRARPDTSRYVDLTVYVGSDWQPPTEALRP